MYIGLVMGHFGCSHDTFPAQVVESSQHYLLIHSDCLIVLICNVCYIQSYLHFMTVHTCTCTLLQHAHIPLLTCMYMYVCMYKNSSGWSFSKMAAAFCSWGILFKVPM